MTRKFEIDVILDKYQTYSTPVSLSVTFEIDVILDKYQTTTFKI